MIPKKLTVEELKKTGAIHNKFLENWLFFGKAFKAGKTFIDEVLIKNERESPENFKSRIAEAFNFPYCQNIVSIYNFFLTEKKAIREVKPEVLERDDWIEFMKNCDLYGTNFDAFLNNAQKLAGAYGVSGVLIDMPPGEHKETDNVYAYLSSYAPINILDWAYERDFKTRKPRLTYLKLRESAKVYLIWTPTHWQRYEVSDDGTGPKITNWQIGENRLGKIPFVFLPNVKSDEYHYLGNSDIEDASLVNAAITRTLSMGNEVMKLAGFPMLLYPYGDEQRVMEEEESGGTEEVRVGADAVLQFDPDAKDGKPAWLESPVEATIVAILMWIDRLTEEMYRAVNLSGLHNNRDKAQTKSEVALRYQFQQTNSVLTKKAEALTEAEINIYRFWAMWQGIDGIEDLITVSRIKTFSVDGLQIELKNMIESMGAVMSDHFKTKMMKKIAKHTFPDLSETDLRTMEDEITKALALAAQAKADEAAAAKKALEAPETETKPETEKKAA